MASTIDTSEQAQRKPVRDAGHVEAGNPRSVVLFGGMVGEPVFSMDRYAASLLAELPGQGWPAHLVKGRALRLPGPRAADFAALEFSRHVLYPLRARRERAGVYHVTDHSFGHLVNSLPRERTVVTCHDLIPWMVAEIYPRRLGRAVGLPLFERSVRAMTRAAHIVCVSTQTQLDVSELLDVEMDRMSVVPNGISDAFRPFNTAERMEARDRLGLPEDACLVLHAGSGVAYKNVETVMRVVALLRERGVPARFVKVGPMTDAQGALLAELGLSDTLHHWRGVGDEALNSLYNAADVLLFPSRYEGFGLPPLEAMRAGLPVVTSKAEALIETTGGLAPSFEIADIDGMADAVRDIWERRDHREADALPGRRHAETFTWERTAKCMAAIYERLYAGEAS